MSGNIIAVVITSLTTILCLVYTNHRQITTQNRKIETLTAAQTERITAHVSDTAKSGGAP